MKNPRKIILAVLLITIIGGGFASYKIYSYVYSSNVSLAQGDSAYFYVRTGYTFDDVVHQLYNHQIIENKNSFQWVAERKNYRKHVYPGKYLIKNHLNNNELVNLLRSGKQTPVRLSLNYCFRKKEYLISKVCSELEADSAELAQLLSDQTFLSEHKLTPDNVISIFIANTYEFYWNTSAKKFIGRIQKEYKKFWTDERLQKARDINLSPAEVIALASIVQCETIIDSDRPIIAGVYMNRLHKNMPLQADPTLVWAIGDFTLKRVLNVHKEINSPYNTYRYTGLPPGPICMTDKTNIDAVLNYQEHNYLYFCAKEDFSGYSNFAESYTQHQLNARRYQKALNEKLKN